MTLIVPNVGEEQMLKLILNQVLTLKLYSNDVTPSETTTVGSLVEVSGGGYASKNLAFANWIITQGAPGNAIYDTAQDFIFTGVTDAPGNVYGYYIIDSLNNLMWIERFEESVVPFTPILDSKIRITPRIQLN